MHDEVRTPKPAAGIDTPPSRWRIVWDHISDPVTWVVIGSAATALALIGVVLYALWLLLSGAYALASNAVAAIDQPLGFVADTINDPIRTYLREHAAALPADPDTLWWAWLILTAGLLYLAAAGVRGARVGWTAMGALTAAMVWAGTAPDARGLAAGVTVATWAVLSTIAFNRIVERLTDDREIVVIRHCGHGDHDERDDQAA